MSSFEDPILQLVLGKLDELARSQERTSTKVDGLLIAIGEGIGPLEKRVRNLEAGHAQLRGALAVFVVLTPLIAILLAHFIG